MKLFSQACGQNKQSRSYIGGG